MRIYSSFFHTLHDEAAPVGDIGRGTHYSVLRAVLSHGEPKFHDFAVIWDEDHDTRVIWVAEQLFVKGMLNAVLAIGERKGGITVLTSAAPSAAYEAAVLAISESVPSDSFNGSAELFPGDGSAIIQDEVERSASYLLGIRALWKLGTKPCEFTVAPFYK